MYGHWWIKSGGVSHRLIDLAPTLERMALTDERHIEHRRFLQDCLAKLEELNQLKKD